MLAFILVRGSLLAFALSLVSVSVAGQVFYHVTALGVPGPSYGSSYMRAINDFGQACGYVITSQGRTTPFFWDPVAGMIDLGDLPGGHNIDPRAQAINNVGHVAGYGISEGPRGEAFLWTPETGMMGLGDIPGGVFRSDAYGINDLDQVVGLGASDNDEFEAFLWDPKTETMIGLGDLPGSLFYSWAYDINNAGQVTGISISEQGFQGFLWEAETGMRPIPPGPDGSVPQTGRGINESGQVTGTAAVPWSHMPQAYVWDPEEGLRAIRFGKASGAWSNGQGINDLGQIVGRGGDHVLEYKGFYWDVEVGVRRLSECLDAVSRELYGEIGDAYSINNRGQIGVGVRSGGVILTPFVLGDMNWDGALDAFDIEAFLLALFDRAAYLERYGGPFRTEWSGDINQDRKINAFDIAPFIELLLP